MMKQITTLLKFLLFFLLIVGASGMLYWLGIMPVTAWLVLLITLVIGIGLFYLGQVMLKNQ